MLQNILYSVYAGCSLFFPMLFLYMLCSLRNEAMRPGPGVIIFFSGASVFIILFKVLIQYSYASFVFSRSNQFIFFREQFIFSISASFIILLYITLGSFLVLT